MNCKPGDLARVVAPYVEQGRDHFVTVERHANKREVLNGSHYLVVGRQDGWVCSGAVPDESGNIQTLMVIGDECLRPIEGKPGNEDFVVKARKTLPRAKPVTGPVTINARGEVEA